MKGRIVIELDGDRDIVKWYLDWWRENEDSDGAYTEGPLESHFDDDPGDPADINIDCTYWIEGE